MLQFAANLSMMYNEHAFLDRFAAAAKDGFNGVEYLFPYEFEASDIRARLDAHGLTQALFNAPPGDWTAGERGMASLPGRQDDFKRSIETALQYTSVIGNKTLHVMAGLIRPEQDRAKHRAVYLDNLSYTAHQAEALGVTVVIEPINTRNIPGFSSIAKTMRKPSAPKSVPKISRCSLTATTVRSSRVMLQSSSSVTWPALVTFKLLAYRSAMNRI